jgi:hypothetical protein
VSLSATMQPPGGLASGRFFRTGYLPTYAAAVFLLSLVWAGAPGRPVDFRAAVRTANHLGAAQLLLVALATVLVAIVLQPLQLSVVRVLEGGFPRWLGVGRARAFQLRRKKRLEAAVQGLVDRAAAMPDGDANRDDLIQRAGATSARLRSRFPLPGYAVRATALGNALAAAEDAAGAGYGLDSVVLWPRLYPLLGDQVRAIVDDLRDGMDASARLAATGALTALAAVALLAWHSGLWTLLALVPLGVAVLAYAGAIRAAIALGTAMCVAFDLHRFDLLRALRLAVPVDQGTEQASNRSLSDFMRQGIPVPFVYSDDKQDTKGTS